MTTTPPKNTYEAAQWLRSRHDWLDQLLTRVVGPSGPDEVWAGWLDELATAFNDLATHEKEWAEYEKRNRPPSDDGAYDTWHDAGPQCTNPAAEAIGVMSGGEVRLLRLVATLATIDERMTAGWRVDDVSFDARGEAVLEDWIAVVRTQLR